MAFTVQNVVDLARDWLNDAAKARYTDAMGERFVNACVQAMTLIRPDLFTVIGPITPTPSQVYQDLRTGNSNIIGLQDILTNVGSFAIVEVSLQQLLRSTPGAFNDAAAIPRNWCRFPSADKEAQAATRYLLYPAPASGNILAVYVECPAYRLLAETVRVAGSVDMAESYRFPLAKATVYCCEMIDDEHVLSQRAFEGMQTFLAILKGGAETKQIETNQ